MTLHQIILEIAGIAVGALGRHMAPGVAKHAKRIRHRHRKPKPMHHRHKPRFVKMYDSVNINAVGRRLAGSHHAIVAGYDDGHYANVAEAKKDYPHHRVVSITVFPWDDEGDFLDVERGNATPVDVPGWIDRRRKANAKFIGIYASASTWSEILKQPNLDLRGVVKWVADWTGAAHIPHGFDGCQYDSPTVDSRLKFDVSLFHRSALEHA